jgi:hypothetical protein
MGKRERVGSLGGEPAKGQVCLGGGRSGRSSDVATAGENPNAISSSDPTDPA